MKIIQKIVNKALYRKQPYGGSKLEEIDFALHVEKNKTYRSAKIAKNKLESSKFIGKVVTKIRYKKALREYYKAVYELNTFNRKVYGDGFPLFEYEEP